MNYVHFVPFFLYIYATVALINDKSGLMDPILSHGRRPLSFIIYHLGLRPLKRDKWHYGRFAVYINGATADVKIKAERNGMFCIEWR